MKIIKAVYQTGVFIPKDVCVLPEGTEVEVVIQEAHLDPSQAADPDVSAQLLPEAESGFISTAKPDPLK